MVSLNQEILTSQQRTEIHSSKNKGFLIHRLQPLLRVSEGLRAHTYQKVTLGMTIKPRVDASV